MIRVSESGVVGATPLFTFICYNLKMKLCVDKDIYQDNCSLKIYKSNDGNYRCQNHYLIFNYGYCKERHLTKVKATGKDGLCGSHRSGKRMKKVLAIGDTNQHGLKIVNGPFNDGNKYIWDVLCPICKGITKIPTTDFNKRKSCRFCKGSLLRKSSEDITWKNHYGMVKGRKISKEKGFDLTLEQFIEISKMNCYYCNAEPTPTKGHRKWSAEICSNGLDRVDSSVGYLISNVVSCCKYCNVAKLDRTEEEFISWVVSLARHQKILM